MLSLINMDILVVVKDLMHIHNFYCQTNVLYHDLLKNAYWTISACKIVSFDESLTSNSKGPIKRVSLKNQPRQATPTLVNTKSN